MITKSILHCPECWGLGKEPVKVFCFFLIQRTWVDKKSFLNLTPAVGTQMNNKINDRFAQRISSSNMDIFLANCIIS